MATIGERLKFLREREGWSQLEMAKFLKCEQPTYQRYETNKRSVPDEIKEKIALRFNITTDYLLGLTSDPNPSDYGVIAAHKLNPLVDATEDEIAMLKNILDATREQRRKK